MKRRKLMVRSLSSLIAGAFLVNTIFFDIAIAQPPIFTLAPLSASRNPKVKREMTASMYRAGRLIWRAHSERYKNLLTRYNALALLLPSGRYLMSSETADNDLSLIRACSHEDFELLMQKEETFHPTRYNRLMGQFLARKDIMDIYRTLSGYKDTSEQPDNVIFNDLIARAFELLFLIDENLVYPNTELTPEELNFIGLMRPILEAKDSLGRYENFSEAFFDIEKRMKVVRGLQEDKDERFYRVASGDTGSIPKTERASSSGAADGSPAPKDRIQSVIMYNVFEYLCNNDITIEKKGLTVKKLIEKAEFDFPEEAVQLALDSLVDLLPLARRLVRGIIRKQTHYFIPKTISAEKDRILSILREMCMENPFPALRNLPEFYRTRLEPFIGPPETPISTTQAALEAGVEESHMLGPAYEMSIIINFDDLVSEVIYLSFKGSLNLPVRIKRVGLDQELEVLSQEPTPYLRNIFLQMLYDLIQNAHDAKPDGEITVSLKLERDRSESDSESDKDKCVLSLTNEGGIDEAHLMRLFDILQYEVAMKGLLWRDTQRGDLIVETDDNRKMLKLYSTPENLYYEQLDRNSATKYVNELIAARGLEELLFIQGLSSKRYSQAKTIGGKGLGLEFIRRYIQRIGGEIHLDRSRTDRTMFTVTFGVKRFEGMKEREEAYSKREIYIEMLSLLEDVKGLLLQKGEMITLADGSKTEVEGKYYDKTALGFKFDEEKQVFGGPDTETILNKWDEATFQRRLKDAEDIINHRIRIGVLQKEPDEVKRCFVDYAAILGMKINLEELNAGSASATPGERASSSGGAEVRIQVEGPDGPIQWEVTKPAADIIKKLEWYPTLEEGTRMLQSLLQSYDPDHPFIFHEKPRPFLWALEHVYDSKVPLTLENREVLDKEIRIAVDVLFPVFDIGLTENDEDSIEAWWYFIVHLLILETNLSQREPADILVEKHLELIEDIYRFALGKFKNYLEMGFTKTNIKSHFETRLHSLAMAQPTLGPMISNLLTNWDTWADEHWEAYLRTHPEESEESRDVKEVTEAVIESTRRQTWLANQLLALRDLLTPRSEQTQEMWDHPIESIKRMSGKAQTIFLDTKTDVDYETQTGELPNGWKFCLEWLDQMSYVGFKNWAIISSVQYIQPLLQAFPREEEKPTIEQLVNLLQQYLDTPQQLDLRAHLGLPGNVEEPPVVTGSLRFWNDLWEIKNRHRAETFLIANLKFAEEKSPELSRFRDWLEKTRDSKRLVLGVMPYLLEIREGDIIGPYETSDVVRIMQLTALAQYDSENFTVDRAFSYIAFQIGQTRGWGDFQSAAIPIRTNQPLLDFFRPKEGPVDVDKLIEEMIGTGWPFSQWDFQRSYAHFDTLVVTSESEDEGKEEPWVPEDVSTELGGGPKELVPATIGGRSSTSGSEGGGTAIWGEANIALPQQFFEFFRGDANTFEDSTQRAGFYGLRAMQGYNGSPSEIFGVNQNDVAALLTANDKSGFFKRPDYTLARDLRQGGTIQTDTSISSNRTSDSGKGRLSSLSDSRYNSIASLALARHSSNVSPWVAQPGNAGTETENPPAASLSSSILNLRNISAPPDGQKYTPIANVSQAENAMRSSSSDAGKNDDKPSRRASTSGSEGGVSTLQDANEVGEAFNALGKKAQEVSLLNSQISELHGRSQRPMDVTKFLFCVPINVLKSSPDITHALNGTGLLKQSAKYSKNIEFELVVTGVTDEDIGLIEGLDRDDIRKALNLPENFTVSMITESEMRETAVRFGYTIANPKDRVAIVKDFYTGRLGGKEYMAIATDAMKTEDDANKLLTEIKEEFEPELSNEKNISVRVLVGPQDKESIFSLSQIINGWLENINQGNLSTISLVLPIPAPLTPELERAIKAAWRVLTAA